MRRELPVFKDFDLPTQHLGEAHYVPPKARSPEEIERRRRLPRGTLLAEQQHLGLQVASRILRCVQSPEDVQFTSRLLAASGINTAWYSFAQNADTQVQRRRLKLPVLTAGRPDWRPNSEELLRSAADRFDEAAGVAGKVSVAIEYRSPRTTDFKKGLGRTTGKASLTLACVEIGDFFANNVYATDSDVQLAVRRRSSQTLNDARALAHDLGTNPSIAQLANPLSDLSVFLQRNAPDGVLDGYDEALETIIRPQANN